MTRKISIRPDDTSVLIPLSKLIPGRRNPRRVKPERDAHRRLVASIRAHGLLQPLVVRPDEGDSGGYRVTAGNRRLAALREIHRNDGKEPRVPCVIRAVPDEDAADAQALAENFAREPMHPLDEAQAFAKLAREDGQGVDAIAADFGVTPAYVRQRMKLAMLTDVVQAAYRNGSIDTSTAEAFAAVPPERQEEVWQEVGGNPQHAHHVRNVIAHAWIDAQHALFDLGKLAEGAVSRDLFNDRVLVERKAFLEAQAEALLAERTKLAEDGWSEVVVGPQSDVQDRLWSMAEAPQEYDEATTKKLAKIEQRWEKAEAKIAEIDDADETALQAHQDKLDALEAEAEAIKKDAPVRYAEATKGVGTAFLILDPDGRVRREFRIPRTRRGTTAGHNGHGDGGAIDPPKPPTPDDLKEPQLAATFTHQALAVREALLKDSAARRRVLALILHEKVRSEALAIRHDANGTTLCADHTEGFASAALDALRQRRAELDPLADKHYVEDHDAYDALQAMPDKQVNALIDLLTVECVTAHLQRRTELVWRLAEELGVNIRRFWRPDERWLAGYQKVQLAHLIGELRGPAYVTSAESKKKSELVTDLAKLFADAAEGRLEDANLTAKLNAWLPMNLRPQPAEEAPEATALAA
jgi:ParB family transcriptional regulator, chromosome partitioning protein